MCPLILFKLQSDPAQTPNDAEEMGLFFNHAYTVTKVVKTKKCDHIQNRFWIRVRNPHGNSNEWKGINIFSKLKKYALLILNCEG